MIREIIPKLRDLRGRLIQPLINAVSAPAPDPTDEELKEKREAHRKFLAEQAARLAVRTKTYRGVGWFPGDPL